MKRHAIHPGEILREEYLHELGITPYKLAQSLKVQRNRIERLVREETPVTADTAARLGKYFKTSTEFWLNMQSHYDAVVVENKLQDELPLIEPYAA